MKLESRTRPLTEAERRLLRCKIREYGRRPDDLARSVRLAGVAIVGVLWLWTLLATDLSWLVVTAVWLVIGVSIYVWVLRDLRKELGHLPGVVSSMESALERNEVESLDIEAVGYAEFEEVADEGACWVFDLGDGRVVFLVGQQFYPSARFPSLDFSVVYPLDEDGASVDMWIVKRGDAVPPDRVIPAEEKWELFGDWFPEPLDVVHGDLAGLEESLGRPG